MNDLMALDEVGAELDPPTADLPGRLRGRVLSAMAPPRRRARWRVPRLGWRLAVTGGLAVALAGGVIVVQALGVGGRSPAAQAEAATILQNAALTASKQPAVVPRADQFVFTESVWLSGAPGATKTIMRQQLWQSVDGTHEGLQRIRRNPDGTSEEHVLPGCRHGVPTRVATGKTPTGSCTPVGAYRADLPTDTDGMSSFLYSTLSEGLSPDEAAFGTGSSLLRENYLPPRSVAALFNALARVPGATVVRNAVDAAGRHGVAVAWTFPSGQRDELFFDARTYEYLGWRMTPSDDFRHLLRAGAGSSYDAQLRMAIVDKTGQLP
jgi:hypothetical protein